MDKTHMKNARRLPHPKKYKKNHSMYKYRRRTRSGKGIQNLKDEQEITNTKKKQNEDFVNKN